jgi:ArsR family transcriptional regulator
LATLPQQEPSTAASDAVPQHRPAIGSGIADVDCGAFPQHPLVPATDRPVAGSPVKPPGDRSVSSMIVSFEAGWFDSGRIRWLSKPRVARGFDVCQTRFMSKSPAPLPVLTPGEAGACCTPMAQQPVDGTTAIGLAPAFKALGDPVRLQLMSMIASAPDGEICVCELTPAFEVSGSTISHHLKTLREAGLVDAERRASWVYYRPRPEIMQQLATLLTPNA